MNNKKGFTVLIVIFILVALIALAMVATYFVYTNKSPENSALNSVQVSPSPSPSPVSNSLELGDIEKELNETLVESPGEDLQSVQKDAAGL